jgi:ABC-type transporter Mla subunit MlaD
MRNDPTRYPAMIGRLSTGMALTQLTWECGQIQDELEAAASGNAVLSDAERDALQKRYQALQRSLAQLMAKAEVVDKHYTPAVEALLREYTAMQNAATQAGIQAPSIQIAPSHYGHQSPLGYSK